MLEENKEEVTSQNTTEEPETSTTGGESENTGNNTQESVGSEDVDVLQKKVQELEEKNRQLYARTKKSEAQRKKDEAIELAKEKQNEGEPKKDNSVDVFELAKQVSALKDFSADELEVIDRQSKALGLSHVEASQHEDVKTLIEARREKNKNNIPAPSTRQATEKLDVNNLTPEIIAGLDPANNQEHADLLNEYRAKNRK